MQAQPCRSLPRSQPLQTASGEECSEASRSSLFSNVNPRQISRLPWLRSAEIVYPSKLDSESPSSVLIIQRSLHGSEHDSYTVCSQYFAGWYDSPRTQFVQGGRTDQAVCWVCIQRASRTESQSHGYSTDWNWPGEESLHRNSLHTRAAVGKLRVRRVSDSERIRTASQYVSRVSKLVTEFSAIERPEIVPRRCQGLFVTSIAP